ncbi:MAG: hypothetical protein ISS36_00985 [Candidatus Aenigmarchaeota archaeon]|nr:hypothetical protein [Candidatus Aenigmarchaeota archaeon]
MKREYYYFLIVFIIFIVGISLSAYISPEVSENLDQNPLKIACEAKGGRWGRIGLDATPSCNYPASDAGKECSDSSECQGRCVADLSDEDYDKAQEGEIIYTNGNCTSKRTVVGCNAFVEDGMVYGILCID